MIEIKTIEDVLPHIEPDTGIFVSERDKYTVIDYAYVTENTFTNPITLECRGLKFDKDGALIARPLHKFFNLFERQSIDDIDWAQPYTVFDKLDGSMVHPCVLDNQIVFMTRGGISPQAKEALQHASQAVLDLCEDMIKRQLTPVFEYTGPQNRIVLAYDQPEITLLAARHLHSGQYRNVSEIRNEADRFGVASVAEISPPGNSKDSFDDFYKASLSQEGIEGYVICFEDGHRVKLKTSAYALRHKALSSLGNEKNVLKWIIEDITDDIHPLLSEEKSKSLKAYENSVRSGIMVKLSELESFYEDNRHLERRDYAMTVKEKVDRRFQQTAFALMDGKEGLPGIMKILSWATHSVERIDSLRDVIGMTWEIDVPADLE